MLWLIEQKCNQLKLPDLEEMSPVGWSGCSQSDRTAWHSDVNGVFRSHQFFHPMSLMKDNSSVSWHCTGKRWTRWLLCYRTDADPSNSHAQMYCLLSLDAPGPSAWLPSAPPKGRTQGNYHHRAFHPTTRPAGWAYKVPSRNRETQLTLWHDFLEGNNSAVTHTLSSTNTILVPRNLCFQLHLWKLMLGCNVWRKKSVWD